MVRWIAACALVLALSKPASAQVLPEGELFIPGDGVNPIVTWCTSVAQTNCMSFFSWFFRYDNVTFQPWGHGRYRADVGFVSAFTPSQIHLLVPTFADDGIEYDLIFGGPSSSSTSPGGYRISDGEIASGLVLRTTRLDDPMLLEFGGERCVTSGDGVWSVTQRCVSVPEPSSLLLLAGGGGLFALVGWRRRRAA